MKICAIRANEILGFVCFNVLGQVEDVRREMEVLKEGVESVEEVLKDLKKDFKEDLKIGVKEGVQIMKEEVVKDIKKDIKDVVKEGAQWMNELVVKDIKKDVKEGVRSMKEEAVKDIKKDVKEGVQSIKEEVVKGIKKDIREGVKEVVEIMKETTENIEQRKMKEYFIRKPMENVGRCDFTYPRVPALGESYLVSFFFCIQNKIFSVIWKSFLFIFFL